MSEEQEELDKWQQEHSAPDDEYIYDVIGELDNEGF